MFKTKRILSIILVLLILVGMTGCSDKNANNSSTSDGSAVDSSSNAGKQNDNQNETKVTINFFSNLPDRKSGQGVLEQTLFDNYMKENPNVTIQVEALQDEPYKQKFKAYAASNTMPDIFMTWGLPSLFRPIMEAGIAAELNPNDYTDYGFFDGALDGFSINGKLYGLPRNTDYMVLYYNKDLFAKNNIKVPTNVDEMIEAAKEFRKIGISPCAINGKDKNMISMLYQDLVIKEGGDQSLVFKALNGEIKFAEDPILMKAANDYKALMDAGFFQDSFVSADYGAANNLFAQEKAAMYYMGEWEVGMDSNPNFSESFKKNVDVINFPVTKDGKGKATDLLGWYGGGYAVSAESQVKDEAIKLLNYMMKPDNWAKIGWQLGVVVPGQKYDSYMTGDETNLQKKLTEIISTSTSISGNDWYDYLTPDFATNAQDLTQQLAAGVISPDEFLKAVDEAVASSGN